MTKLNGTPKCTHCGYQFDADDTWHGDYTVGRVYFDEDTVEIDPLVVMAGVGYKF